jgi:hypothetical protein
MYLAHYCVEIGGIPVVLGEKHAPSYPHFLSHAEPSLGVNFTAFTIIGTIAPTVFRSTISGSNLEPLSKFTCSHGFRLAYLGPAI